MRHVPATRTPEKNRTANEASGVIWFPRPDQGRGGREKNG